MILIKASIIIMSNLDIDAIGLTKQNLAKCCPYGEILINNEGKYKDTFSLFKRLIICSDITNILIHVPYAEKFEPHSRIFRNRKDKPYIILKKMYTDMDEVEELIEFCFCKNIIVESHCIIGESRNNE